MHVVDELGAATEALLGNGIEVADDDVGLQPVLEERVGPAVDADEHRTVLADVGAQRGEIRAVVVTAHDDERVAALEVASQRGQRERLEHQARFLVDVLERVGGEALELGADGRARFLHRRFDLGRGEYGTPGEQFAVAPELALLDAHDVAFVHAIHAVDTDVVEEDDPRADDADGPPVRVTPRDRRRAVHHRDHAGFDEAVGRDAVEIAVVDDRDVARLQARDHVLRAPVDPRRALDRERGVGLLPQAQAGHQRRPLRGAAASSNSAA